MDGEDFSVYRASGSRSDGYLSGAASLESTRAGRTAAKFRTRF
jgi:hypothetical protein